MNYRELQQALSRYTKDFTLEEGSFPVTTRADLNNAKTILAKHYNDVTSNLDFENEDINGTDYQVNFGGLMYFPDKNPSVGPLGMGEDLNNTLININEKLSKLQSLHKINNPEYRILMEAQQNILEALEKHNELNPDLWEDNELKPEVKEKLEEIVDKFVENLAEDDIKISVDDIVLVGSNANYNYTEHSDIDTHIVANMDIYKEQEDLAIKLYDAYKRLFNNKYDPTIYGHEVELYVEPDKIRANSNGMYSLNTGWIKEPEQSIIPDIDEEKLNQLVAEFENKIEGADTIAKIDDIIDELYILRQESILKEGEYGIGNQCFKEIRNMGLLQKLKDDKIALETQEMSLEKTNDVPDTSLLDF